MHQMIQFFGVIVVSILAAASLRVLIDLCRYGVEDVRKHRERGDELRRFRDGLSRLNPPSESQSNG